VTELWMGLAIALFTVLATGFVAICGVTLKQLWELRRATTQLEDRLERLPSAAMEGQSYLYLTALTRDSKFWSRMAIRRREKTQLARAVSESYIEDGMKVILDSGTTVDQVPSMLRQLGKRADIYTNNLLAAISAVPTEETVHCHLLPGLVDPIYGATYEKAQVSTLLKAFVPDRIVLAARALSYEFGPMVGVDDQSNCDFKEFLVRLALDSAARTSLILVVDWSKLIVEYGRHSEKNVMPVLDKATWRTVRAQSHFSLLTVAPPDPESVDSEHELAIARESQQAIRRFSKADRAGNEMKVDVVRCP